MSVLITGLKMPEGELGAVPVVIFADGAVYHFFSRDIIGEATPVPPHGRLGDLDALKAKAVERSEKCGVYVNVLDKVITAYDIETTPTIIPAEEDKK